MGKQRSVLGDLVFCRPAPDDYIGQLVARATGGPYSHVQIRLNHYEVIEALSRGVVRDALEREPDPADVAALGGGFAIDRQAHALGWLIRQVGDRYSIYDILADAAMALWPRALGSATPFLIAPSQYDCSDLAVRFLLLAGYKWLPDDLAMDSSRVSPNGLARALGVIK